MSNNERSEGGTRPATFGPIKKSVPIKCDDTWRILRHDGVLVGFYKSRQLALRAIQTQPWLE